MANRGINETVDHALARFWPKVNKKGEDQCWEWLAGLDLDGYGLFKYKGRTCRAARFIMMALHTGTNPDGIPSGKWILHTCDNPKCVNPCHLYFGTPSQNSIDRERRGRGRNLKGRDNGYSKLTDEAVLNIRAAYIPSHKKGSNRPGPTLEFLAQQYGVTRSLICLIVNRRIWTHV